VLDCFCNLKLIVCGALRNLIAERGVTNPAFFTQDCFAQGAVTKQCLDRQIASELLLPSGELQLSLATSLILWNIQTRPKWSPGGPLPQTCW
jgi:hypothetical protein